MGDGVGLQDPPGRLEERLGEHVIVDVGTGYYVKKVRSPHSRPPLLPRAISSPLILPRFPRFPVSRRGRRR